MADNIINNKTFSSAVNAIADLDSTYARELFVSKNNVQLNTQTYTMKAYITTYNTSTMTLETKLIVERSVIGNAQIKSALDSICSGMHTLYPSITATNTVTVNGTDFDIQVDIVSPSILVSDVNVQFIINGFTKYDIHSGSDNYIKILPFLTSIGEDAISTMKSISPYTEDISKISTYVTDIRPVNLNKDNINCVASNISCVSKLACYTSNIAALSPVALDVKALSPYASTISILSANAESLNTLAANTTSIVTIAGRIDEIKLARDNINQINVVANCVYPHIPAIIESCTHACCSKLYKDSAYSYSLSSGTYACSAKDYATKMCGEVETGLYSAKYYACCAKAISVSSPSQIICLLSGIDGSGSGLDADTVDGYHASTFHVDGKGTVVSRDSQGNICSPYIIASCGISSYRYINIYGIGNSNTWSIDSSFGLSDGTLYSTASYFGSRLFSFDSFFGLHKRVYNNSLNSSICQLRLLKLNRSSICCTYPSVSYLDYSCTSANDIYGISFYDIQCKSCGIIAVDGKISNINATGSLYCQTWNNGDKLYLKPGTINGEITNIEPADNEIKIYVGTVLCNSNGFAGSIDVSIKNINQNELKMISSQVSASGLGVYTKTEINTSYGTVADFEGALL